VRVAGLLLTLPPPRAAQAAAVVSAALALAAGCMREPAQAVCPELAAGQLVITEIRGTQNPKDSAGPWIELYNASGRTIDLIGIRLAFRNGTGLPSGEAFVRRSLPAAAGSYTVLGLFSDADPPPHVDYGFFLGNGETWLDDATLAVETCGTKLDQVGPYSLPRMGTYSLGGAPDANRNDFPTSWCTDRTLVGPTFPGTPGAPNVACP